MKYAHFDPNTRQVIGWIDTVAFHYDSLPSGAELLEVTDAEYERRTRSWWVSGALKLLDAAPVAEISLAQLKALKSAEITEACAAAILAGFTCEVLGRPYHYPSGQEDQLNLTASATAAQIPENASDPSWVAPFTCRDPDTEVWGDQLHSAAQIQQVANTSYKTILALRVRRKNLLSQIDACLDAKAIDLIVWS